MGISIEKQVHDFLMQCKSKNTWVYEKADVKKSVREFLSSKGMMFSPYDKIYVVKKSTISKNQAIKNNIFNILEKLGGILSGEFVMKYYLGKKVNLNNFIIYKPKNNFITYLGDDKKYKVTTKELKIQREIEKIKYEGAKLVIESPLSFIVNNINKLKDNELFKEFVLSKNFEEIDIVNALLKKYKISGLSKLAIFYKNYGKNGQYLLIKKVIEESGKKLDRRGNKVKILKEPKIKEKKVDIKLDDLI